MSFAAAIRFRLLASVLSVLVVVALLIATGLWWLMRRNLPRLDGTAALPGLSSRVTIDRDAAGVPTIRGATRSDVACALGYLHAQDRFFQMDLQRRRAAGELSEIFGKSAVPLDREARIHGLRALARQALALLPPEQSTLVAAYTAGVNAGLASMAARPFEYYVLRVRPRPWLGEDTVLVGYSMALDLQDPQGRYERTLAAIQSSYGLTLLNFLVPAGTESDAALDGSTFPRPQVPGPEIIDLRKRKPPESARMQSGSRLALRSAPSWESASGSNAFALAGSRTANGSALLANDMHLHLGVPNTWYRASLIWGEEATHPEIHVINLESKTESAKPPEAHRVTGVTIPGIPLIIAGSNGQIAWGFTNSYADTTDVVTIEPSSIDPLLYKNGDAVPEMQRRKETILVKGKDPVEETVLWTIWGPVIGVGDRNRPLALRWVFHDPAVMSLGLVALETATDVPTALALAPSLGLPAQNLLVADHAGAIGWTITGRLPRRVGFDGRLPAVWAYGDRRWDGYLPPEEYPRILSPATAQLWSANNRSVGGTEYAKLGDGGYDAPDRARQIRDGLSAITAPATPGDLLAVQLDDRAVLLERWQQLLLTALTPDALAANKRRAELRRLVRRWNGHASIDSVAYYLVRRWRQFVADRALGPIFEPCADEDAAFDFHTLHYEAPLWQLVQERPANFLTPDYLTWDDLLLAAADDVLRWADEQDHSLARLMWGTRNTVRIQHPFSRFLPSLLSPLFDMPSEPLPGDRDMPRVQGPSFGASERFVVSPGHEDEGIFHMPGGQSGNPLSPFYRAGHAAWARGTPTPFLPGTTVHTLRLRP
jgi:penicillin amidase